MNRWTELLKSKTFWGAVFAAGGYLVSAETIGISEIVTAIGVVIAAAGVKDNFTKTQNLQAFGATEPPTFKGDQI